MVAERCGPVACGHPGGARAWLVFLFVSELSCVCAAQPGARGERAVPLRNASFEEGVEANGTPKGWLRYGSWGPSVRLAIETPGSGGGQALLVEDSDVDAEVGVHQAVVLEGGTGYELSADVRAMGDGRTSGAFIQLRFLPSGEYLQTELRSAAEGAFGRVSVFGVSPPGTTRGTVYVYTHSAPTPRLLVDNVTLIVGATPPAGVPPRPVPPVYERVKPLHLTTSIVADGQAKARIVVPEGREYSELGASVQACIHTITGVTVPVVGDSAPDAGLPLGGHVIALGNRSTNRLLSAFYDRYYCLVDLKYPGRGGSVVRSLHSPLGDGWNVVIAGGSDTEGVAKAAAVLNQRLRSAGGGPGRLAAGRLQEIGLGEGMSVPERAKDALIWEESATYGSSGYFGWNLLSKQMALYHMTGDEAYAREFLRLAFPDDAAVRELEEADGERIENKHDPLGGPYHYSAHMMVLFWDLIEESPAFTDADRLRITNALSRQLAHRAREGVYGQAKHKGYVGNRHADWSATSLYCLARYFAKDYPDPVWESALGAVRTYFSSLADSAWLAGNNDHLFWYTSYYDPILDYLIMSGDRVGLDNGTLEQALRTQDVLFTGSQPDWGLRASSLNFLHRAAHLTGDGRWLFYRDRTGLDTSAFRLGQSYWPSDTLRSRPPTELKLTWTVQGMPEPMWRSRRSGLPLEQSFLWASFRTTLDESGDYVLLKGHNGGGRNPYHTFSILELRLAGSTLLKGYQTQVLTSADGLVEPAVAMDAALIHCDVVGGTAIAVGEVPKAAFSTWRRSLVQRPGRYALAVDALAFREESRNMRVSTRWGVVRGRWDEQANALLMTPTGEIGLPAGSLRFGALDAVCTCSLTDPDPEVFARLEKHDEVLLRTTELGAWVEMPFELANEIAGEVFVELLDDQRRGTIRMSLDGTRVGDEHNHYAPATTRVRVSVGHHRLAAGGHVLRVESVARRGGDERCWIGLRGLAIRPDGVAPVPVAMRAELRPADVLDVTPGGHVTFDWIGPVSAGEARTFFTLIGRSSLEGEGELACLRLAANAAVFLLPEAAIAVVGSYGGVEAALGVVAHDHLFGRALRVAGAGAMLVRADVPIDVDWDFVSGELEVSTDTPAVIELCAASARSRDGEAVGERRPDGLLQLALGAGRHAFEGVRPGDVQLKTMAKHLAEALQQGRERRQGRTGDAVRATDAPQPPALDVVFQGDIGAPVGQVVLAETAHGPVLACVSGKAVHVLKLDGTPVRRFDADASIRAARWWPEHRLFLAGCADEKVIAFSEEGERRWEFVSEMDRAVWEAAKQYWFKSAHPGIYGLHTDVFLEGSSQCFVGSACTLEILGGDGKLLKRLPVFWGPGWRFAVTDAADGSRDLLIARQPTDTHALAIVNSRTLKVGRGFDGVPSGHTYVTGWSTMSRGHILCRDMDGDGCEEVVSEINGVWNRITVWDRAGRALHNAQLGPGKQIPHRNVRDLAVGDLDGDGKPEIVAATSGGLVVALDGQCRRLWSARMPTAPSVLALVEGRGGSAARVVVGCEGGSVVVLDGAGRCVAGGQLGGHATAVQVVEREGQTVVVLASEKGEVTAYRMGGG